MPKIINNELTDSEKKDLADAPYLDTDFNNMMKYANNLIQKLGLKNKIQISKKISDAIFDEIAE